MNETTGQTLADGWWCTQCEMFEDADTPNVESDWCPGCGCMGCDHVPVEVVAK